MFDFEWDITTIIIFGIIVVFFGLLVAAACMLFEKVKSALSFRKLIGNLYYNECTYNYKLDKLMKQGASNTYDLEKFASKKFLYGIPVESEEDRFACSAFYVVTPDSKKIMGRNFDYAPDASLLTYTKPKKGYTSYAMTSLGFLGIEENGKIKPDTIPARIASILSPLCSVDGLNEKGLCVSILELETEPTSQSTGRTPITTTSMVRILLDKCATTDEAVEMLKQYDMHSSVGSPYHFLISDSSGKCVVVEWPENQLTVINATYLTNFQLSEGKDQGVGIGHERYRKLKERLESTGHVLSEEEAMDLLKNVSIRFGEEGDWQTEWSLVYNIDEFKVTICNEMNYDNPLILGKELHPQYEINGKRFNLHKLPGKKKS